MLDPHGALVNGCTVFVGLIAASTVLLMFVWEDGVLYGIRDILAALGFVAVTIDLFRSARNGVMEYVIDGLAGDVKGYALFFGCFYGIAVYLLIQYLRYFREAFRTTAVSR